LPFITVVRFTYSFSEFSIGYVPLIDPIVVSEDAGTVEIIRVEKRGQIEQQVDVTFSGGVCVCVCVTVSVHLDMHESKVYISGAREKKGGTMARSFHIPQIGS
jgi:hypothetical protein